MSKIKEILKMRWVQAVLYVAAGLIFGWIAFGGSHSSSNKAEEQHKTEAKKQIWTCSMHPQIKMDKPGKCPICAMDLIPLKTTSTTEEVVDHNAIQLSEEAVALANIQTTTVGKGSAVKEVQLYGTLQPDERNLQSQTAHVGGRIEDLYVDFTGESVQKGRVLARVYSPELYNAQQELLEAAKLKTTQPRLLDAAREKLRLLKLTDGQIAAVEASGKVSPYVDIKANTSGVVVTKNVSKGDYINPGSVLFEVANLSKLWAMFEAYETDLPFVKVGERLNFTLQAMPGKNFTGRVAFIDPVIDRTTRTAKVRVEIENQGRELKPEMFATAYIKSELKGYANRIVVPKSAVLWTGERSIVYVRDSKSAAPVFMLREVTLGPSLGSAYVVTSGLNDGDNVVTNGVFSIDASAQLEGKKSMMNPEGAAPVTGHEGHNMGGHQGMHMEKSDVAATHGMVKVQGLCDMCKERIEKAAKSVAGVSSASWDKETKQLHLMYNSSKTSIDAISKVIAAVGHDAGKYKAPNAIYNALPECCRYR